MNALAVINLATFLAGPLLPALLSPVCFHVWTRGAWRDTRTGRHLMAYATVLGITFALTAVGALTAASWLLYVAPLVNVALAVVLWQRIWAMWDAQHPNPADKERAQ